MNMPILFQPFSVVYSAYQTSLLHFLLAISKVAISLAVLIWIARIKFYIIWGIVKRTKHAQTAQRKRALTDYKNLEAHRIASKSFKKFSGVSESDILRADISQLHGYMLKGQLLPTQLLDFYTIRTYEIGCRLSLVAEIIYDFARPLAEKCDLILTEKLQKHTWKCSQDMPQLFGIPTSFKDVFEIEGYDTTLGSASQAFRPSAKTGNILI